MEKGPPIDGPDGVSGAGHPETGLEPGPAQARRPNCRERLLTARAYCREHRVTPAPQCSYEHYASCEEGGYDSLLR